MNRTAFLLMCLIALLLPSGCSRSDEVPSVPVSGRITVNGKPLAKAWVAFYPEALKDRPKAPVSSGQTDEDGRYSLKFQIGGTRGAVVGNHTVTVSMSDYEEDSANDEGEAIKDPVPPRFNMETELKFTVPEGGSESADFNLKLTPAEEVKLLK